ncbi:FadR/GntR family transcriptional regulator [Azospirillum sp. ST 5-10]|uniref:FadR/GntR family transcriptional regulator n=1 Tax=unclassified Azospirillum TaxID=2630922 RepID=UPI003F49F12A
MVVVTRSEGTNGDGARASDKVFAFFRDKLLNGELKPGDRLLGERELAIALDVSRPLLRESLRSLAMLGFLDIQHGRGTVVRHADLGVLRDFFTFCLAQQPDILEDVMQGRIAIECQAIRLACERATERDLAQIQATLDGIMATLTDPQRGGEADHRFHWAIVRASHSGVLVTMYEAISALLLRSHVQRRAVTTPVDGIRDYLADAHREVFLSLFHRDADEAERKLREHFAIGDEFRRRSIIAAYRDAASGGAHRDAASGGAPGPSQQEPIQQTEETP